MFYGNTIQYLLLIVLVTRNGALIYWFENARRTSLCHKKNIEIKTNDTKSCENVKTLCIYKVAHLIHASLVESHDGGMGEPVEHSAQCLLGVKVLWLEKLFQELFVEHGGDNVIHNCPENKEKRFR